MNLNTFYKLFHPILWILVGALASLTGNFIQDNNLMPFSNMLLSVLK